MSFPQDPPASGSSSDLRREPREHMFDKVVTPSDVGKLNRLVIPKQHAEKYFPLDSAASDKGLLLNFEDRNGKPWRFRYSYWNSSQSYVMTKGWSRFVKEKKLDAGDVVSFQRGLGELAKDRLFIDWRRRPDAPPDLPHHFSSAFHYRPHHTPWAPFLHHPPPTSYQYSHFPAGNPYGVVNGNPCPPGSIMYLRGGRDVFPAAPQIPIQQNMVFESVPVVQGKATAKRLRLFGVNMDFPISGDSDNNNNNECDISAATTMPFDSSSSSSSSSLARLRQDSDIDKGLAMGSND